MREIKRTVKSVMAKKGIKTGQIADELGTESMQVSVWLSREDGKSIEKLASIADILGCDLALVDRKNGEVYK